MNILVVQGPNLNLLGEADGDPIDSATLTRRIQAFAAERGAALRIVQSNHEGALIDALQAERAWADAVLVDPAALAHSCDALRECLRILGKPAVEVHLGDLRGLEPRRRRSVLEDVCEAQIMGRGPDGYLEGLERLISGRPGDRRRGRPGRASERPARPEPVAGPRSPADRAAPESDARAAPRAAPARPARTTRTARSANERTGQEKTLGRRPPPARPPASEPGGPAKTLGGRSASRPPPASGRSKPAAKLAAPAPRSLGRAPTKSPGPIDRAAVRERIAARLGGQLTPAALAAWAREQWLGLERGGPAEAGRRELLSDALQALALSLPTSDHELIDLMARLQ